MWIWACWFYVAQETLVGKVGFIVCLVVGGFLVCLSNKEKILQPGIEPPTPPIKFGYVYM